MDARVKGCARVSVKTATTCGLGSRQTFEGDRLHAVSWFRKGDEKVDIVSNPNPLNAVINKFIK